MTQSRTTMATSLCDDDLRLLTTFVHGLTDASGSVIRPHFRAPLAIENKAGQQAFDPVTIADREAEQVIRQRIRASYPDDGIFGEEHGREYGTSSRYWVIDPIDGTRSFVAGLPTWGTLIALNDGQRPILGVMDQPFTGERFTGSRLGAAFHHRGETRPLKTRVCANISEAVLCATTEEMFVDPRALAAFRYIGSRVRLQRFGGDCYAYCLLALGFVDLVIEASLKPYDIQALVPIVEAAGGVVTSWSGDLPDNGGRVVAAGDPRVHAQALRLLEHVGDVDPD